MDKLPLIDLGSDYYIIKFANPKKIWTSYYVKVFVSSMGIIYWYKNGYLILFRKKLFSLSQLFEFAFLIFLMGTIMEFYYKKFAISLSFS